MKPVRSVTLMPTPGQNQYMGEQNAKVLAGNVSFGASFDNTSQDRNIRCFKASGTTPNVANTEFSVAHNLGTIPIGFLVVSVDQPGAVIHKSTTAWTTTAIFLKCNVVSVNYAILII